MTKLDKVILFFVIDLKHEMFSPGFKMILLVVI